MWTQVSDRNAQSTESAAEMPPPCSGGVGFRSGSCRAGVGLVSGSCRDRRAQFGQERRCRAGAVGVWRKGAIYRLR